MEHLLRSEQKKENKTPKKVEIGYKIQEINILFERLDEQVISQLRNTILEANKN